MGLREIRPESQGLPSTTKPPRGTACFDAQHELSHELLTNLRGTWVPVHLAKGADIALPYATATLIITANPAVKYEVVGKLTDRFDAALLARR